MESTQWTFWQLFYPMGKEWLNIDSENQSFLTEVSPDLSLTYIWPLKVIQIVHKIITSQLFIRLNQQRLVWLQPIILINWRISILFVNMILLFQLKLNQRTNTKHWIPPDSSVLAFKQKVKWYPIYRFKVLNTVVNRRIPLYRIPRIQYAPNRARNILKLAPDQVITEMRFMLVSGLQFNCSFYYYFIMNWEPSNIQIVFFIMVIKSI